MKRLLVLAILLLALPLARAEGPDDQYVRIYSLIQEGDALNAQELTTRAFVKYLQAQTELQKFQHLYPDWNSKVINFRLNYLASRIAEVTARAPAVEPSPAAAVGRAPSPPSAETVNQLNALREQVRQLQVDKSLLESKVREALAAQPAMLDPRELARAEDRIKSLQKENALLNASLAQKRPATTATPVPSPVNDTKAVDQMKRDLADANHRLTGQAEKINALEAERKNLQARVETLQPAATALEAARKSLAESNRKLAEQSALNTRLLQDKEALQARLKSAGAETEVVATLRSENDILKRRLTDMQSASAGASKQTSGFEKQLAEARAQIAALQSDREFLREAKASLETQVKQLTAQVKAAPAPTSAPVLIAASAPPADDSQRVRALQRERDELRGKLDAAQKELYERKSRTAATRVDELKDQISVLRTRLAVFEAPAIPYTPQELAMLKPPESQPPPVNPVMDRAIRKLPAGTAVLVTEAQRSFANHQYDRAEENYKQVLLRDDKSVNTLANLAVIQMEENHLDDADKNIQQAVALAPSDSYSLGILGYLKFRQGKYDEALDALSRAAALDPKNPEIQNRLGIALSQKGLREAAEKAFRKAIQIDPNYGDAHNNMAVFYLTQSPPSVSLARWHYQRALDTGFPHNLELEKMLERAAGTAPAVNTTP